jgi:hypothetical protein
MAEVDMVTRKEQLIDEFGYDAAKEILSLEEENAALVTSLEIMGRKNQELQKNYNALNKLVAEYRVELTRKHEREQEYER